MLFFPWAVAAVAALASSAARAQQQPQPHPPRHLDTSVPPSSTDAALEPRATGSLRTTQDLDAGPHVTFVSGDRAIAFAMSIPDGATDSFYFQMRAHRSHAWAAIGLGSDDMPGSLVLMMYDSSDESNVTFSPRVAHGHREPEYFADMEYHLYGGTGIYDQHMVVTGICTRNCLSWRAGDTSAAIDITNESEGAIYALGPLAGFNSDNPRSSVQFHVQYGSFNMNMSEARGATVPLAVDLVHTKTNDGTVLNRKWIRKADVLAVVHAVCMVMAFVLIMPLGAVMLRLGQSVRWHALTQTSALVIVIVGFGVGVATSLRYQRSRNFDTYHQVLGILLTIFVLGQFGIGFYSHRRPLPRRPTWYSKMHPWTGRAIIFLGIMNGFLGFTFGMNRRYAIILAALVLAMCGAIFATIIGKRCLMRHRMATRPVMRPSNGPPFERLPTYPSQGPAPSWPGHAYGPPPPPPGQNPYYYPPAPGPPQEQQVQYQYPYPYPLQHGIVLQQQPVGAPAPAPGAPTAPGDAAHTPAPAQAYQPPAPRELI